MERVDFIDYVLDFYNADTGIYKDVGATEIEVVAAVHKLERKYEDICYDSLDRERVRDIILESRK